jgi:hypothetical protein
MVFSFKLTVTTHAYELMLVLFGSQGFLSSRYYYLILHHDVSNFFLLAGLPRVFSFLSAFQSFLLPQLLFFFNQGLALQSTLHQFVVQETVVQHFFICQI